ncbi:hypothetical protein M758_UG300100 [Ceratodon purpureus]|nr:hypothetical protein M758_UG300100 [Ceratodon purpureus]
MPGDVCGTEQGVGAPIFHCNGDDPEGVAHCCRLAVEWRQKFETDVVVDLVCYRRHGHNKQDDPRATQPLTYQKIVNHPRTLQLYSQKLINEGIVTEDVCCEGSRRFRYIWARSQMLHRGDERVCCSEVHQEPPSFLHSSTV